MYDVNQQERTRIVNKTVGVLIFSIFGFMGFFFSLWINNWHSAAWCLLLEIACVVVARFTWSYLRFKLNRRCSVAFFRVKYVAVALALCSWGALVAYISVGVVYKEEFDAKSHYAVAPVTFLAGFWFSVLIFDCRKYETLLAR